MKIVVVGYNQKRLNVIKEEIRGLSKSYGGLCISTSRPNCLEAIIDSNLKLLIFDTQTIDRLVIPFINQLRRSGYQGPVILLGKLNFGFDFSEFTSLPNSFHLEKPYRDEKLVGLAKNCINLEQMRQRRDQRFDVCEQAVLEAYSSDFKTETLINNISRSGVRIEGDLSGLKKGDLLRLHFTFEKIKKERVMSARVVWLKKESDSKEEAGLEFVSQKAVYQYLLDYAVA